MMVEIVAAQPGWTLFTLFKDADGLYFLTAPVIAWTIERQNGATTSSPIPLDHDFKLDDDWFVRDPTGVFYDCAGDRYDSLTDVKRIIEEVDQISFASEPNKWSFRLQALWARMLWLLHSFRITRPAS